MLLCHISCGSIQSLVICIILNINEKNRTLIFIYLFHFVVCLVQSELAALMYMKTRLVRVRGPGGKLAFGASGEAEVVSARGYASFWLHPAVVNNLFYELILWKFSPAWCYCICTFTSWFWAWDLSNFGRLYCTKHFIVICLWEGTNREILAGDWCLFKFLFLSVWRSTLAFRNCWLLRSTFCNTVETIVDHASTLWWMKGMEFPSFFLLVALPR